VSEEALARAREVTNPNPDPNPNPNPSPNPDPNPNPSPNPDPSPSPKPNQVNRQAYKERLAEIENLDEKGWEMLGLGLG